MRSSILFTTVTFLSLTGDLQAQVTPAQADELRRQVESLQQQLQRLESGQPTHSQKVAQLGSSRSSRGEPVLVVRVYDLSDLFSIAPAYSAAIGNDLGLQPRVLFPEALLPHLAASHQASGMGGMGGGMGLFDIRSGLPSGPATNGSKGTGQSGSADVAASAKTSLQSLISAITSTINPDSWEDLSGPGSIARIGTSLIIRNDAGVHEQIEALFTLLRQKWRTLRTVSVTAWWLPLSEAQLQKLLPEAGKGATGVEGIEAFGIVDEVAWKQLLAGEAQAQKKGTGAARAVITCYNGQTVSTISGAEEGIVNEIEPIVVRGTNDEPQGRIAYRPLLTPIHEGTSLQITPLVNVSGNFAMLDIHSRVTIRESAPPPRRQVLHDDDQDGPAAVAAALDRPRLLTQRLATTLRTPMDRVLLVGGMTFNARPQGDDATLYLFLRTTVQELRDDPGKPAPVEPPANRDTAVK
jgi:hypothetical protein